MQGHCTLRLLWTLPEGDAGFPGRWWAIKTAFSKSVPAGELRSSVMQGRGGRGIWQHRYREHTIRDDRDDAVHRNHTHFNPVKHGLVEHPAALGEILHAGQPAVAKIEKRTDMDVSPLRRLIEAMGGELEITAHFPDHGVRIRNFRDPGEH
jgi:hypothetical protein